MRKRVGEKEPKGAAQSQAPQAKTIGRENMGIWVKAISPRRGAGVMFRGAHTPRVQSDGEAPEVSPW